MATISLNIYKNDNKNEVEKTYTVEGYDLMLGTVEDVLQVIDIEKLNDKQEITKMALKCMKKIKPLLVDIFPGVTDEELNRVKVKELIEVIIDVCAATAETLDLLGQGKN